MLHGCVILLYNQLWLHLEVDVHYSSLVTMLVFYNYSTMKSSSMFSEE